MGLFASSPMQCPFSSLKEWIAGSLCHAIQPATRFGKQALPALPEDAKIRFSANISGGSCNIQGRKPDIKL
jgi:hypothetical protein